MFNVLEEMKYHKENPQCYKVEVVENLGQGMSTKDQKTNIFE